MAASTGVAAGLAPDVLFTSVVNVFAQIEKVEGDVLVVGDTSVTDFQALERERDARGRRFRLFYLPEAGSVIITVPTAEHEDMHTSLGNKIVAQVGSMGLLEDWQGTGSTTYPGPGGSSGEGDTGGHPRSMRDPGEWPTLVIESGDTQTMPLLYAKMRWWFSASDHGVNVVILMKMIRHDVRLHIERWQTVILRPGATATRRTRGVPRCLQTIDICWDRPVPLAHASRADRKDPNSYRVEGGPLTIDFALVFLRAPGTGEHDFVVDDRYLRVVATSVLQRV